MVKISDEQLVRMLNDAIDEGESGNLVSALTELQTLRALEPQQEEAVAFPIKLVDFIWEELCEEDRSSPEDQPDMALVCRNDLLVYAEKWNERQATHPTPVQKVQESQTVSEEMVERFGRTFFGDHYIGSQGDKSAIRDALIAALEPAHDRADRQWLTEQDIDQ